MGTGVTGREGGNIDRTEVEKDGAEEGVSDGVREGAGDGGGVGRCAVGLQNSWPACVVVLNNHAMQSEEKRSAVIGFPVVVKGITDGNEVGPVPTSGGYEMMVLRQA